MVPFLYFHTKKLPVSLYSVGLRHSSSLLKNGKGRTRRGAAAAHMKRARTVILTSHQEEKRRKKEKKRKDVGHGLRCCLHVVLFKSKTSAVLVFSFLSLSPVPSATAEREKKNVLFRPCLFIFVSLRKRTDCSRRERIGGFCQTADDLKPL